MNKTQSLSLLSPFSKAVELQVLVAPLQGPSAREDDSRPVINKLGPIQFALGRKAASCALLNIGGPDTEIKKLPNGSPAWPSDERGQWVGSISHTVLRANAKPNEIVAAAAVAPPQTLASIGLDIESTARDLNPALAHKIATSAERGWIGHDSSDLLILACAKEALYKAYSPLFVLSRIGFQDAELELDKLQQTFWGTLHIYGVGTVNVLGKYTVNQEIIAAGVEVSVNWK